MTQKIKYISHIVWLFFPLIFTVGCAKGEEPPNPLTSSSGTSSSLGDTIVSMTSSSPSSSANSTSVSSLPVSSASSIESSAPMSVASSSLSSQESLSSMIASSVSSIQSSSSSELNSVSGQQAYVAQCESCHGDDGAGPYSILGVCNHTDCDDTAALASYIGTNMPLTPSPQTCVGECAQSVAQYIVTSLRVGNSSSAHSELTFQCDAQATPEADVWRRLS